MTVCDGSSYISSMSYGVISVRHQTYRQISNISRILVGDKLLDHLDVVEASPVGAAPTTSSFST